MNTPHKIALLTDSTCDIPDALLEKYDIRFASQYLIWGTEEYRDRVDISSQTFYERLRVASGHPSSSQPVENDFIKLLEEAQQDGAQEAVIITISSQLSGTVDSARNAAARVNIPVYVVDSLTGGMALGWQVLAAARARESGGDAHSMIAAADEARAVMQIIFFVDSLDALYKGGRIGGAARLLGSMLNLKPILYVDHIVGRVEPAEQVRTRNRALSRVYEMFFEQMVAEYPLHVAVIHSDALEFAKKIAARVKENYPSAELIFTSISPVMGTHIGPGAVGLAGYYER